MSTKGCSARRAAPGGTRRYSTDDIDRLRQIMILTSDGLNLAGVRKVLELQEETRRPQTELTRLAAAAHGTPPDEALLPSPGPVDPPDSLSRARVSLG
jgi:DNA-binding transcriptional MerR regulator